jgi:hypothetical protein
MPSAGKLTEEESYRNTVRANFLLAYVASMMT